MDTLAGMSILGETMRPRPLHRIFASVCGLWLALSLAEPAALHACAMHGSQGATHVHGSHGAMHGRTDAAHSPRGPERGSSCTCPGGCCIAAAIAVPCGPPLVVHVVTTTHSHVLVPTAITYRPAAIAYARPPTIGPPHFTA